MAHPERCFFAFTDFEDAILGPCYARLPLHPTPNLAAELRCDDYKGKSLWPSRAYWI